MNPDVIYGRDFEEESMEIEKIDRIDRRGCDPRKDSVGRYP